MELSSGSIHLNPYPVQIRSNGMSIKAEVFRQTQPRGSVILARDAAEGKSGMVAMLLDALLDANLCVLALGEPRRRRNLDGIERASAWLREQPWAGGIAQGLLGFGSMGKSVLDLAAVSENYLKAVAVYEGSPEMSGSDVDAIRVPTLFVVGPEHPDEEEINLEMSLSMRCKSRMLVMDRGLTSTSVVSDWFVQHFFTQDSKTEGIFNGALAMENWSLGLGRP